MAARHRRCPTPTKVKYPTKWEAVQALRRMPVTRGEVNAYQCKSHWHLSHRPRFKV